MYKVKVGTMTIIVKSMVTKDNITTMIDEGGTERRVLNSDIKEVRSI